MRCPLTYKALDYAYSDLIPRGRHPFAVVVVSVNPSHLDVNIHPTKKEIKYSNANEVYVTIQRALIASLRQVKTEAREAEVAREREEFHYQVLKGGKPVEEFVLAVDQLKRPART